METTCKVCLKSANKKCSGCQIVYYCGREHQKQDWQDHKSFCKIYMIKENPVLGRYLVANRDIRPGEVILCEEPLIRGPSQVTSPVCLGCLDFLIPEATKECPACGWPTCKHQDCHKLPDHQPECAWAMEKRKNKVKISQFISPHPSYECITALRICYQRESNPNKWKKLISLETHCETRKNTPKLEADRKSVAELLHRFYNLKDDFSIEEILKICGIIEVNGHEVPTSDPPHVAVYSTASMLEHNCHPNCSKSFTNEGNIVIHAAVPIKKGENISICYTDSLWSTGTRRQHLLETKYFSCRCKRCLDPTEFNTYFSAIKCERKNCGGPVLPPSFCDGGTVAWQCEMCGSKREWTELRDLLQLIGSEIDNLDKENILSCTRFLEKWKSILHRNHFYLTEIGISVAQQMGQLHGVASLSDNDLKYKVNLCKHLTSLLTVLTPGECRTKGVLWFELHTTTAEIARRNSRSGSSVAQTQQLLNESRGYLENTILCLKHEPKIMPEGKLFLEAKKIMAELEAALKFVSSV